MAKNTVSVQIPPNTTPKVWPRSQQVVQPAFVPSTNFLLTLTGTSGGPIGGDGNANINLFGSGLNIIGNPGTHSLTFQVLSPWTWNGVTSITPLNPIQLVSLNAYICNGASMVTFLLPLSPNIGDSFIILSNTARFQILENGSQQICIGTSTSTAGSGDATSNSTGDQFEFVYVGSNIFRGFAPQGTLTLN